MGKDITPRAADGWGLDGYRAEPTGAPVGGLVVCRDIFGINHPIRDVCEPFAEPGYLAVVRRWLIGPKTGWSLAIHRTTSPRVAM